MKNWNKKLNLVLVVFCIIFIIGFNQCDAGKDKHKQKASKHEANNHRNATQQQHHQQKNSTAHHHQNHTVPHDSINANASHNNIPSSIGWSLHNNENQPHPGSNPHGYAIPHHNSPHLDQQHQVHQPAYPSQAQHNPSQQDSGPSALSAGIGGLALGALGGVAGGYILNNALNSNEETTSETVTESVTETTLSTLPSTILSQDPNDTIIETSTEAVHSSLADESLPIVANEITTTQTSDKLPFEIVTSLSSIQPQQAPLEILKSEQKVFVNDSTTNETLKDNNNGVVQKLSLTVFLISFASSYLLYV